MEDLQSFIVMSNVRGINRGLTSDLRGTAMADLRGQSPFPPVESADENGIVCAGGELNTNLLIAAYSDGIFPWPHEGYPLLWFCPWKRGVLQLENLHLPRSFLRQVKKSDWTLTVDRDFDSVIRGCRQAKRKGQQGTWINSPLFRAYCELHRKGYAHSFEIRSQDRLVGGLYGVFVAGVMSAESMFFVESGASKAALVALCATMKANNIDWIDIQMLTPLTSRFGGIEVEQKVFLQKLNAANRQETADFRKLEGRSIGSIIETNL